MIEEKHVDFSYLWKEKNLNIWCNQSARWKIIITNENSKRRMFLSISTGVGSGGGG